MIRLRCYVLTFFPAVEKPPQLQIFLIWN
uniref:Uncharacterized protein n=1 Tax=Arundo donax TaxID=35708 RepID=A0A0A9BL20_ARUDO